MAAKPTQPQRTWFYDILEGAGKQTVVEFARHHDWRAQLVFNSGVTAYQPAGITIKMTVLDLLGGGPRFVPNVTVRAESAMQVRLGTELRLGVDESNSSKKHEYAARGEPFVDVITIKGGAKANLSGWRAEIAAKAPVQGSSPFRFKAVARSALVAGASVSLTRIWRNPSTGVETRVDFILVAKGEAAGESLGLDTKREPLSIKGEVECQVRVIRSDMQVVSAREMANWAGHGAKWAAQMVAGDPARLNINTLNGGDRRRASYLNRLKASTGTPVWELARYAGGRNHGNPALALVLKVNAVLRQGGVLATSDWVRSSEHAAQLLQQLWARSTPSSRARIATALSNRLGVNFSLPAVDALNQQLLRTAPMTFREKSDRAFFH